MNIYKYELQLWLNNFGYSNSENGSTKFRLMSKMYWLFIVAIIENIHDFASLHDNLLNIDERTMGLSQTVKVL